MTTEAKYMEMALEIAFSRLGKTSPNPSVGAVIVKNGHIISTGGTSTYGSDHAEVVAIKNAKADLSGADMYVSLEPCCHNIKKTPPCTEAIKKAKLSRVYIPVLDPNPSVAGKGVQALRDAGIDVVIMTDMAERAYDLIRHFTKYILKGSPYVIHKSALTLDGKIATKSGDSKWISSEYSRYIVHKLRSLVDVVMVGKNTFIKDNPALNIRLDSFPPEVKEYFDKSSITISGRNSFFLEMLLHSPIETPSSPLRVVVGVPERLDMTKKMFSDDNYLFFSNEAARENLLKEKDNNMRSIYEAGRLVFVKGHSRSEQAKSILEDLYGRNRMMILLEGGGTIAGSFFDAGEVDQFVYFYSPRIIGKGLDIIGAESKNTVSDSLSLHDISTAMLKDDLIYNAYSEPVLGVCEETECLQD